MPRQPYLRKMHQLLALSCVYQSDAHARVDKSDAQNNVPTALQLAPPAVHSSHGERDTRFSHRCNRFTKVIGLQPFIKSSLVPFIGKLSPNRLIEEKITNYDDRARANFLVDGKPEPDKLPTLQKLQSIEQAEFFFTKSDDGAWC